MNTHAFREYDVRGIVGEDLVAGDYERLGRALGTYLDRHGAETVVIGRDIRPSSDGFSAELRAGLMATGRRVLDVGTAATPMVVFALNYLGGDASAAVTASHNPAEYNGLKVRRRDPIFGEELQVVRGIFEKGDFASGKGWGEDFCVRDAYIQAILGRVHPARALKVVVDAGNGCGGLVGPDVLHRLGFEVVPLYCEPDGSFPNHHPDPTVPDNLRDLQRVVQDEGADCGVAFDGDADRVALVDETGAVHWADRLVMLLARRLLSPDRPGTVVYDVKCSQGVAEVVRERGGTPLMVKTGYPHILAGMKAPDALLGAELSGHMYFGQDPLFNFDDGVYSACRVLEVASRDERPLSEQFADLPRSVSTPEIRAEVPEERKFAVTDELTRMFRADGDVVELVEVDGARAVYPEGWGLVRASNTGPSLVLVFEARDAAGLAAVKARFAEKLERFPEVAFDLG